MRECAMAMASKCDGQFSLHPPLFLIVHITDWFTQMTETENKNENASLACIQDAALGQEVKIAREDYGCTNDI
jgi:hypothetical protein